MFDDFLDEAAAEVEAEKKRAWRKKEKWLQIVGITNEDLKNGSDYIEKLKYPPWDKRNDGKSGSQPIQTNLVGFGKYSNLTYEELKTKNLGYFLWAVESVPRFRAKAKELGLI